MFIRMFVVYIYGETERDRESERERKRERERGRERESESGGLGFRGLDAPSTTAHDRLWAPLSLMFSRVGSRLCWKLLVRNPETHVI